MTRFDPTIEIAIVVDTTIIRIDSKEGDNTDNGYLDFNLTNLSWPNRL